jgi:hypothetical protein
MLSGVLAGLANAVIARLLMRVVAIVATGRGNFSVGGTANIFMFAVILGSLMGLAFGAIRRWLPGPAVVKGLLYSAILVVIFQIPVLLIVRDFAAEIMAVGTVGIAVFALINLAYCQLLAHIYGYVDRRVPETLSGGMVGAAVVMGLIALVGLGLLIYEVGGRAVGLVR